MSTLFTNNLREHVSRCAACAQGGMCRHGVDLSHRALDRGVSREAVAEAIALGQTEFMLHKVIV